MPLRIRGHVVYPAKAKPQDDGTRMVMHRNGKPSHWTPERIDLLKKLYRTTGNEKLALLLKTTVYAIKAKARDYGLYKLGREDA